MLSIIFGIFVSPKRTFRLLLAVGVSPQSGQLVSPKGRTKMPAAPQYAAGSVRPVYQPSRPTLGCTRRSATGQALPFLPGRLPAREPSSDLLPVRIVRSGGEGLKASGLGWCPEPKTFVWLPPLVCCTVAVELWFALYLESDPCAGLQLATGRGQGP